MGPCACFYDHVDFLILMKPRTVDLLILKNITAVFCEHFSIQKKEKHLSLFSPKLYKYVTTGGLRHLNRLKVALAR